MYNIADFGAAGDGRALDTQAIQKAVDACHAAGGGTVLVPAGKTFVTGTVRLKGRVTLHVENGARLLSSDNPDHFTGSPYEAMIAADGADHVAITGQGVIDGRARAFMTAELPHIFRGARRRPHTIVLTGCRHVTIRDVTIQNAAHWALHPAGCQDVLIHGIRILNDLKVPNGDGIDPDHCRNVRICDCHVEAGDDCICIKNERPGMDLGPTENITVTGCTLISTSSAIKIGSGSCNDFRNLVFQGCVVSASNRGLGIQMRDEGNLEDVIFADMVVQTRLFHSSWWGKAEPIYVTAIPRVPGRPLGRVRHVRFSNILCRAENGAYIAGSPESPIEDLVLDGVRIQVDKWTKWPGGWYDRRPCSIPPDGTPPEAEPGLVRHATAGVYAEYAKGLVLRNTEIAWGPNVQADWGHALEAHHVADLRLEGFRGAAGRPGLEPTVID